MCSSLLQLAPGSRVFSQAEKIINKYVKLSKLKKNDTQNCRDNEQSCKFWVKIVVEFFLIWSALHNSYLWDKSRDPGANWRKLEHM